MADQAAQSIPKGKIVFRSFHKPQVHPGNYTLELTQNIDTPQYGDGLQPVNVSETSKQTFSIQGPRFSLSPHDLRSVFPPSGSEGDHANTFAHVVLNRTTLPWERSARTDIETPWLALLVFDADKAPTPKQVTAQNLVDRARAQTAPHFGPNPFVLEDGQHPGDRVTVIEIQADMLNALLPDNAMIQALCHVRQWGQTTKSAPHPAAPEPPGPELAVVVGSRLPSPGKASVAHLVSLEQRMSGDRISGATGSQGVWLVSLHSWSFSCRAHSRTFRGLIEGTDRKPETLRLPDYPDESLQPRLATLIKEGFVPLAHRTRDGGDAASLYRGPLVPFDSAMDSSAIKPIASSDALLRVEKDTGFVDVSHAAAWELGRLLTLQSSETARLMYRWKRRVLAGRKDHAAHARGLPIRSGDAHLDEHAPTEIAQWFMALAQLKGVPFDYLVPDARLLPVESLRFVALDSVWVDHLLDGAFAIGRVSLSDALADEKLERPSALKSPITGILLRSQAVASWPDLQVSAIGTRTRPGGQAETGKALKIWNLSRLSDHILLALFEGKVDQIDIGQMPETMHFGVQTVTRGQPHQGGYQKPLRDRKTGKPIPGAVVPVTLSSVDGTDRVVDLISLRAAIKARIPSFDENSSADLALQLVEGVDRVRFMRRRAT